MALTVLLLATTGIVCLRAGDLVETAGTETEEIGAAAVIQEDVPLEQDESSEEGRRPSFTMGVQPQRAPGQRCDPGKDEDCRDLMEMEDLGSDGPLGGRCDTSANCVSQWQCVGPPEHPHFVGGYCGLFACKSDVECGPQGICAEACGGTYCLRLCSPSYCRHGYACREVQGDKTACVPRCDDEDDADWED